MNMRLWISKIAGNSNLLERGRARFLILRLQSKIHLSPPFVSKKVVALDLLESYALELGSTTPRLSTRGARFGRDGTRRRRSLCRRHRSPLPIAKTKINSIHHQPT